MSNCKETGVHPGIQQRIVSDVIICIGIRNDSYGAHEYELARQVTVCQDCGCVTSEKVIERNRE